MSEENVGIVRRALDAVTRLTPLSRKIKIKAPIRRCYETAADLENMPEWHRLVRSIEVSQRDRKGRVEVASLAADMDGSWLFLTMRVSYEPPRRIGWEGEFHWKGRDVNPAWGRWTFEDLGNGRTKAIHTHGIEGHEHVTQAMRVGSFYGEWDKGLKRRAEKGPAAGLSE